MILGWWFNVPFDGFRCEAILPGHAPQSRNSPRPVREASYCDSAKTYMALLPLDISASGVKPTPTAASAPPLAAMAIYWRPLIEYDTASFILHVDNHGDAGRADCS